MFMHSEKYSKWIDFLSQGLEVRTEFYDGLHDETKRCFEVVVGSALAECKNKIEDETLANLEVSFSHLVYAGYFLHMITVKTDVVKEKYATSKNSAFVGEHWMNLMESFKSPSVENLEGVLEGVDIEDFAYLNLMKNSYVDKILFLDTYLNEQPYAVMSRIENMMNWVLLMGYKIAQIEVKLNQNE